MKASKIKVGMVFVIPSTTDIDRKVTVLSVTADEVEYTIEGFANGAPQRTPIDGFVAWVSSLQQTAP